MDQNDLSKHTAKTRTIRTPKVRPAKEAPPATEVETASAETEATTPAPKGKKAKRAFAQLPPANRLWKARAVVNGAIRLLKKYDLGEFGSVADYTSLAIETLENAANALPAKTSGAAHKTEKGAIVAGAVVHIKPTALKRYADILGDQATAPLTVVDLRGKSALVEFAIEGVPSALSGAKLFIKVADLMLTVPADTAVEAG